MDACDVDGRKPFGGRIDHLAGLSPRWTHTLQYLPCLLEMVQCDCARCPVGLPHGFDETLLTMSVDSMVA